jgi:serine/threonine-protein kinase
VGDVKAEQVGRTLGRYQILEALGSGAIGVVYKAIDPVVGRTVALKVLEEAGDDPVVREQFAREASAAAKLRHPNLITVYEVGEGDGLLYLAMELVEGGSLRAALRPGQPLEVDQAVEIVRQVGEALSYIHGQGFVHRDLKPSNVLLKPDGRVLLTDLGLLVPRGAETLTSIGTVLGTPSHMSPEQAMGQRLDARSDLFCLGLIAYETLTGRPPFEAGSVTELLYRIVSETPPRPETLNPALPPEMGNVVLRALEKSAEARQASVDEFVRALQGAAGRGPRTITMRGVPVPPMVAPSSPMPGATAPVPSPASASLDESTRQTVPLAAAVPVMLGLPSAVFPAWLLAVTGSQRGVQFPLGERAVIGRDEHAEVALADSSVSRRHASLERRGDGFHVVDQGSRNGTWVNGQRVSEQRLGDRDEVRVGNVTFIFIQAASQQEVTADARARLRQFEQAWAALEAAARGEDRRRFDEAGAGLVDGPLREAIGYRVEQALPSLHGVFGFVVRSAMMWIRHSRFPILLIAHDPRRPDVLPEVTRQVELAKVGSYFALLVVVPTQPRTGNEAAALRQGLADSVYRHDFVVLDRDHLASIIGQGSSQRLVEIILEQGIDVSMLSPYLVRGPVPESMFFGREREIKAISQSVRRHDYALVGGRRIGKSSILLKLARVLGYDGRFAPVYLNCEDKFEAAELLLGLGEGLEAAEPVGGAGRLRALLQEQRKGSGSPLRVFLLDEVDEVLSRDVRAERPGQLFKTLRALSHEGLCRFVFSGSRSLHRHLHDPGSPFFNFCDEMPLSVLDGKSVAEIVSRPLAQLGFELPDREQLVERMIRLTGGHPNLVQWLCDHLVRSATARRIDLDLLASAASETAFHEHFLETAWGDATPLERLVSLVVEGPEFEFHELLKELKGLGLGDRPRTLEALRTLELFAVLERKGSRYRFLLPEFGRIARAALDLPAQVARLVAEEGASG